MRERYSKRGTSTGVAGEGLEGVRRRSGVATEGDISPWSLGKRGKGREGYLACVFSGRGGVTGYRG